MPNWEWIRNYYGWIAFILGIIFVIVKIDLWVDGTDKSAFLVVLSSFVKDIIVGGLILAFFILLWFYMKEQE